VFKESLRSRLAFGRIEKKPVNRNLYTGQFDRFRSFRCKFLP